MILRKVSAALTAVALLMVWGGTASADDNRFAVVTVNNNTSDVTIHFSYRWGNGAWKQIRNLKPGKAEYLSMTLNAKGNAPRCQIKIDEAIGAATRVDKVFNLKWKAAPDKGVKFGHQFEIVRDKSDNDYVSVYDQNK